MKEKPYSAWPVVWETLSEPRKTPWKDLVTGKDQCDFDWMYEQVVCSHDHPCTIDGGKHEEDGSRVVKCHICQHEQPYGKEPKAEREKYLSLEAYKPLRTGRLTTRENPEDVMAGGKLANSAFTLEMDKDGKKIDNIKGKFLQVKRVPSTIRVPIPFLKTLAWEKYCYAIQLVRTECTHDFKMSSFGSTDADAFYQVPGMACLGNDPTCLGKPIGCAPKAFPARLKCVDRVFGQFCGSLGDDLNGDSWNDTVKEPAAKQLGKPSEIGDKKILAALEHVGKKKSSSNFDQREQAKAVTIELKKTRSVNHFEAQNPLAPWNAAGKAKRKNEGRSRRTSINLKEENTGDQIIGTMWYERCSIAELKKKIVEDASSNSDRIYGVLKVRRNT
jgi:hypothetical protein